MWTITDFGIGYLLVSDGTPIAGGGGTSYIGLNFTAVGGLGSAKVKAILTTGTAGDTNPFNDSDSAILIIN
jgi:hypothetical protein